MPPQQRRPRPPVVKEQRLLERRLATASRATGVLGPRMLPFTASNATAAADTALWFVLLGTAAQRRTAQRVAASLVALPAQLEAIASADWSGVDDAVVNRLARATATGAHVLALTNWHAGGADPQRRVNKRVTTSLEAAERAYVAALARLRRAAKAGDAKAAFTSVDETLTDATAKACAAAAQIAQLDSKEAAAAAIAASGLARRAAMLSAGAVVVGARLARGGRGAKAITRAADTKQLRRRALAPGQARVTLGQADVGRTATVVGRVDELGFVERPQKPYSRATLAGSPLELRVPRRNMRRVGVAHGSWVCGRGHVKEERGQRYVEVEFEGPGTHRKAVFEDWLADLVRPVYDLYPGVLLMEWQLPAPGERGSEADAFSRLGRG
jgi:hypothetical protein